MRQPATVGFRLRQDPGEAAVCFSIGTVFCRSRWIFNNCRHCKCLDSAALLGRSRPSPTLWDGRTQPSTQRSGVLGEERVPSATAGCRACGTRFRELCVHPAVNGWANLCHASGAWKRTLTGQEGRPLAEENLLSGAIQRVLRSKCEAVQVPEWRTANNVWQERVANSEKREARQASSNNIWQRANSV